MQYRHKLNVITVNLLIFHNKNSEIFQSLKNVMRSEYKKAKAVQDVNSTIRDSVNIYSYWKFYVWRVCKNWKYVPFKET